MTSGKLNCVNNFASYGLRSFQLSHYLPLTNQRALIFQSIKHHDSIIFKTHFVMVYDLSFVDTLLIILHDCGSLSNTRSFRKAIYFL